jgi:hypothetical protein
MGAGPSSQGLPQEEGPVKLSVDPGVSGAGFSLWNEEDWCRRPVKPYMCGNLYAPKRCRDYIDRTDDIIKQLLRLVEGGKVDEIWCEMPEFMDGASGRMVATKGDLAKLTLFTGAVFGMCIMRGIRFHPVEPSKWKGQTSKEMVARKILHILPEIEELNIRNHAWDAVGIGLWAQNYYVRNARPKGLRIKVRK